MDNWSKSGSMPNIQTHTQFLLPVVESHVAELPNPKSHVAELPKST